MDFLHQPPKGRLGYFGPDDIEFGDGPSPVELMRQHEEAKALQARKEVVWKYWKQLDEVWLDYTTHEGAPQDFNWECKNCGTRNDEGADVDNNYYTILECDNCGTDYRIIDPR